MLDNGIRHKSERLSQFPPGSGGAVMFTSHARSPPNGLPTIYHITWRKDGTCFTPLPIPFAARMFVIMNKNVKEKRYDTTKPRKLDAGHTDTQITLINKGDSKMNDEIKATMNCGKDNSNVDGLDNGSNPSNIGGPGNGNGPGNKNTKLDVKITKDAIIRGATEEYIKKIDPHNVPAPNEIAHDLNLATRGEFVVRNIGAAKNDQWRLPSTLYALQIAMIISAFEKVICIIVNEMERCPELEPIAVYMDSGGMEGLYDISDLSIKKVIHKYDCMADEKKVREIIAFLREMLPHKLRTMDPNLVAVNNGIFNTQTKQLMAFSPDYIFLTKSKVNYVDNALNPNIKDANGRIWDVET